MLSNNAIGTVVAECLKRGITTFQLREVEHFSDDRDTIRVTTPNEGTLVFQVCENIIINSFVADQAEMWFSFPDGNECYCFEDCSV